MSQVINYIRSRNPLPILIIFYLVGLAGMIIPATRDLFKQLTPFVLLLTTGLLFLYHDSYSKRFWFTAFVIFLAGYFVEVLGVNTGVLFGEYAYGKTLGIRLFSTPLMIGVNWLMLVYCTSHIAGRFDLPLYFRSVTAAAAMVVYDFALEPAAINFDMWSWEGIAVPLQNYLVWFAIAFLLNLFAGRFELSGKFNKIASPLFFVQLAFFILLDIWIYAEKIWV